MLSRLKTELWFVGAGIVLLGVLLVAQHIALDRTGGTNYVTSVGVPFDDVYIHCRYVQNLLAGHGYSFNPPEQVTADTSPLWVLLIAAGGLFTNHLEVVAVILSSLAWLLLAPGVYRIAKYVLNFGEIASVIAGTLMLLNGPALGLASSGMETSMAILLALVGVEAHIRSRDRLTPRFREAIILGVGILTRPELFFLALLCGGDWLLLFLRKRISFVALAKYSLALFPFVGAYLALPLGIENHLSYHSSIVQGFGFRFPPDLYYIARAFGILFRPYVWFALLLTLFASVRAYEERHHVGGAIANGMAVLTWDRIQVPLLFFIGLPILQGFVAPQYRHFGRYFFPLIPIVALMFGWLFTRSRFLDKPTLSPRSSKIFNGVRIVAVAAIVWSSTWRWINVNAHAVANINDQHLAAASWVLANCSSTDVIAADDVGALGYFTKRNVIDLTGLVSPDMFPLQHNQRLVWQAARVRGANVFIIYKRLNPSFYEYAKDSLELAEDLTVRPPLVSSADTTMGIYRVKGASNAAR